MGGADKLLSAVKGLPLWMVTALAAVAVGASLYAPLQAGVPAALRGPLPLVAALLVSMTVCGGVAHLITLRTTARAARAADDRLRVEQIYGPLVALFTRRHVTACTGVLAPYLKNRMANAWGELFRYRRVSTGLRRALQAIGDRKASTSAEVEYGGDFPMEEIHERVAANAALAGPELLNLVRRADRSRYEDGARPGLLTDEEYDLFTLHPRTASAFDQALGLKPAREAVYGPFPLQQSLNSVGSK